MVIRHHLETENRLEAARAYRMYCSLLAQQLAAQPSQEMNRLAATARLV
jgi:hypothetical protein